MPATASVRSISDSLQQDVLVRDRHWITTDEPATLGGEDAAPTPYELLAAAVAACVVTTIRMYARRKAWDVGEIAVDATFNGDVQHPHCTLSLELPDDLDDEQRARLEHVAHACAVHRTLQHGVTFERLGTAAVA